MKDEKYIIIIEGVVAKEVSEQEAMDWVWSEHNCEEHPLRIYNEKGEEVEW